MLVELNKISNADAAIGRLTFPRRKYTGDSLGTSSLSSSNSASASSYRSAAKRMEARSNLHRELCKSGGSFNATRSLVYKGCMKKFN